MAPGVGWSPLHRARGAAARLPCCGSAGSGNLDWSVRLCIRYRAAGARIQAARPEISPGPPARTQRRVTAGPGSSDSNGGSLHPQLLEGELRILGSRWSPRVHEIKSFLSRSRVPFRWIDSEQDQDARNTLTLIGGAHQAAGLFPDGTRLIEPDVRELAARLGLDTEPDDRFYDLIVVGGGPAGISGAICSASEGLRTLVVEQEVPGGQISYSAMVENYPGFPQGLSGSELTGRAVAQAERFGAE